MIMKKMSETKEKLLQVGFDLIWDSSYGSVSVDDICKRAGINKGSFYHFFPSKADLVVEAYEEEWKLKRPAMDRIFSPKVPRWNESRVFSSIFTRGKRKKRNNMGTSVVVPLP